MSNNTEDDFEFSITNVIGEDIGDIIVYSNEGYMIKTKIGKMPSGYRKNILWDFGDGNTKMGYEVSHYYTKPGKYEITCTLFNSRTREGKVFESNKTIHVKELIPSIINVKESKSDIKCSKIERIARLECLLSNTVKNNLNVNVKRVDKTTGSYFDVKDNEHYHIKEKYWTLLHNEKQFYYGTNTVYSNNLVPSELFTPTYTKLYYRFSEDMSDITLYQIANKDDVAFVYNTIKVLKPNCHFDKLEYKEYVIETLSDESLLPQDVIYCGMRGFVDVFYRNDEVDEDSELSVFYDIENKKITNELESSTNYLNIIPIGLSVKTISNKEDIKIGVSGNYFLNDSIGKDKTTHKTPVFIDNLFEASLYNGLDLNCYVFPFCSYDIDDIAGGYYVPKDVALGTIIPYTNINNGYDEEYGYNSEIDWENVCNEKDWLVKLPIKLHNYIDIEIPFHTENSHYEVKIYKKPLRNLNQLELPQENRTQINVNELLDSYMKHPSLSEQTTLRDMLKAYLNGVLPQIQSNSENFIDNISNIKTCYLSNLLSQLQMMGDEVIEFETSNLEGINDLKNIVRFLSMNHSDLVGHKIDVDWDIAITSDSKGKHVGAFIGVGDELFLCEENGNNFAKIYKIKRNGEVQEIETQKCDLIIRDKFTNKTEIVNFRQYLSNTGANTVKLEDYEHSWGWNLLLPDGFTEIIKKIKECEQKRGSFYENEKNRLKHAKRELIRGYYDFYFLVPKEESERQGNFLNEKYINSSIESVDKWEKDLGITHDMVMKVLVSNGELLRDKENIYDDKYEGLYEDIVLQSSYIFEEIPVSSFDKATVNMAVREIVNKNEDDVVYKEVEVPLKGTLTIQGKIYGEGENTIWIDFKDGLIDSKDKFSIGSQTVTVTVKETTTDNGEKSLEIEEKEIVIPITGETITEVDEKKSKLKIKISGDVENPTIETELYVNYKPHIIIGEYSREISIKHTGCVYNGSEKDKNFDEGLPLTMSLCVQGYIEGSGKNRAIINLNKSSFIFENDHENKKNHIRSIDFKNEIDGIVLDFDVDENGNISIDDDKLYYFKGVFEDVPNQQHASRSFTGEGSFKLSISGTTEKFEINIDWEDELKFVYNYPELYARYDDWQFIKNYISYTGSNDIDWQEFSILNAELQTKAIIHSSFEENDVEKNTYLRDLEIILRAKDEITDSVVGKSRVYSCWVNALYEIESYSVEKYKDYIWNFSHKIENLYIGDCTINEFGDIESATDVLKVEISKNASYVPRYNVAKMTDRPVELVNGVNIQFKLEGNVPDRKVQTSIITDVQPEGVYLEAYGLNEIFEVNGHDEFISDNGNIRINGCKDFDKVSVGFVDSNELPYGRVLMASGYHTGFVPYIRIELYKEQQQKELICHFQNTFGGNQVKVFNVVIDEEGNKKWVAQLCEEQTIIDISKDNFETESGYNYDLQERDEDNTVTNSISIDKNFTIKDFILNIIERKLFIFIANKTLYTNESVIETGEYLDEYDATSSEKDKTEEEIQIIKNRKYIGKCSVDVKSTGFKPIYGGDVEQINLICSISTSVLVKEKKDDEYKTIEEVELSSDFQSDSSIPCWIKGIAGDATDKNYVLYGDKDCTNPLDVTWEFSTQYLDINDYHIDENEDDKDSDINYSYTGYIKITSNDSEIALLIDEWEEEDSALDIVGSNVALLLDINFDKDDLKIISRLLKGSGQIPLKTEGKTYWVKNIPWKDESLTELESPEENLDTNQEEISSIEYFNVRGDIIFDWIGTLKSNEKETELKIDVTQSDLNIGEEILKEQSLDNDKVTLTLNEEVSCDKTSGIIDQDYFQNGISISYAMPVDIKVDRGVITLKSEYTYIQYINYNYNINDNWNISWNDVTNFDLWLDEQDGKKDEYYYNGIAGFITIEGKGISHEINDSSEKFTGNVIIKNPKLNGVKLDTISEVSYKKEVTDTEWIDIKEDEVTIDGDSYIIPLTSYDPYDTEHAVELKFKLSRGNNFIFAPILKIYREQPSDRDEFKDCINSFTVGANVELESDEMVESQEKKLSELMSFETGSNAGQSWKSDAIPVYNLSNNGDSVQSELVADKTASASGYIKVSDGLIYTENSGYNGKFDCKANVYGVSSWNTPMEDSDLKSILSGKINDIGNIDKNFGINSAVFELDSGSISKNGVQIDRKLILSGQIDIDGGDLVKTDQNNGLPNFVINDLKLKRNLITISATKLLTDIFIGANGNKISVPSTSRISFGGSTYWGGDKDFTDKNDYSTGTLEFNDITNNIKVNDLSINGLPMNQDIDYIIDTNDEIKTKKSKNITFSDSHGIVKMTSDISLGGLFNSPQIKTEETNVTIAKWLNSQYSYTDNVEVGTYKYVSITFPIDFNPLETGENYPDNGYLGSIAKKYIEIGTVNLGNITLNATSKVTSSNPITLSYNENDISYDYTKPENTGTSFTLKNDVAGITLDYTIDKIKKYLKTSNGNIIIDDGYCSINDDKSTYTIRRNLNIEEKDIYFGSYTKDWSEVFKDIPQGISLSFNSSQLKIIEPKCKVFNYLDFTNAIQNRNIIKVNGFSLNNFRIQGDSQINLNTSNNIDDNDKIYVVLQKVYYGEDGETYVPIRLKSSLKCSGTVEVQNGQLTIKDKSISLEDEEIYFSEGTNPTWGSISLTDKTYDDWTVNSGSIDINKEKYVKTSGNTAEIVFSNITIKNSSGNSINLSCPTKTLTYNINDDDGIIYTSDYQTTFSCSATNGSGIKFEGTLVVSVVTGKKFYDSGDKFTGSVNNVKLIIPEIYVDYKDDGSISECNLTGLENSEDMFKYQCLSGESVDKIIQALKYNPYIDSIDLGISRTQTPYDKEILKTYNIDVEELTPQVTIDGITYKITWRD